jgi:hypothetical protein
LIRLLVTASFAVAIAVTGLMVKGDSAHADHFTNSTLQCQAHGKAAVFKCDLAIHLGDVNSGNTLAAGEVITVTLNGNAEIMGAAALGSSTCKLTNPNETADNVFQVTLREDCLDTVETSPDQVMYINLTLRATNNGGGGLSASIDNPQNSPTWVATASGFTVPTP